MKCNNCQSEWTARVTVTIAKCPFCGHDLTQVVSPVVEQQPSFAETLKAKTKTKQQLAEEKERSRARQIQDNVQRVVRDVKSDCSALANRGIKKLDKNYTIYSYECRSGFGGEWELCQETSSLVKQALQKEGFRTVSTSLRRGIARGYVLHVTVRW